MSIARSLGRYLGGAAVLTVAGASGFAVPALADTADEPRNIIVMIGDGMGFNHVDAANLYEHGTTNWQIEGVPGEQITQQDGYGSTPGQIYEEFDVRMAMSHYSRSHRLGRPCECHHRQPRRARRLQRLGRGRAHLGGGELQLG